VQVDPIKITLKPPGAKRLKLNSEEPFSTSAFKFNLRRYTLATKYPESFDASVPEDLVYSGKYNLTDVEPETGMTVGKLVLSPTRTYAPVVKAMLDTLPRSSIHGRGLHSFTLELNLSNSRTH